MSGVDLLSCQLIPILDILCGVMMGCQLDIPSCSDRSCGSSRGGVALAVPSTLNRISHWIPPLFLICHLLSSRFLSPSSCPQLLHHIHFILSSLLFCLPAQSKVTPDLDSLSHRQPC